MKWVSFEGILTLFMWFVVGSSVVLIPYAIYEATTFSSERKEQREHERSNLKFQPSDMVRMKAFGHTGMVISISCWKGCTYSVRFSAIQNNTNTRIFGAYDPIDVAPVSVVSGIREYELEHVR